MTKSNSTKKALVFALLSTLLCVSMLIGTTFAWFTDTASTAVNKITTGNIEVKLMYSRDGETWQEATEETKLFEEGGLFEPGYTQIVYVKVVNTGSLALKFGMNIACDSVSGGKNVYGERYNLNNYLMFGYAETDTAFGTSAAAQEAVAANAKVIGKGATVGDEMVTLAKDEESNMMALVLYMPSTLGNEVNPKSKSWCPKIRMSATVVATQAMAESDSNGNQYDQNAPTIFKRVEFTSGTHEVTGSIQAEAEWGVVHVKGGTTTINATCVYAVEDNRYAMAVYAENAGTLIIINSGDFAQQTTTGLDQYDLIYADDGAQIEINGGTFKSATPKWTLNCKDNSSSVITVKGGSFYQFNPATDNPGEVVVPDGYKVVQEGDWYTVVTE